jgi:hypothetical protein
MIYDHKDMQSNVYETGVRWHQARVRFTVGYTNVNQVLKIYALIYQVGLSRGPVGRRDSRLDRKQAVKDPDSMEGTTVRHASLCGPGYGRALHSQRLG